MVVAGFFFFVCNVTMLRRWALECSVFFYSFLSVSFIFFLALEL